MDKLSRDRFIIIITTIACLGLTVESFMAGWEFWMSIILVLGTIGLWASHITQRIESSYRDIFYLCFAMLASFFHGVHQTSFFDVALISMLMLATFSLLDKNSVLLLILAEYFIILAIQFVMISKHNYVNFDSMNISRVCLHVVIVICFYFFCRLTIKGRMEYEEDKKKDEEDIKAYETDMEDFLSNISHELRTPVNVVNGMAMLIKKKSDGEEVGAISDAGIRLSNQIEDIQDYTELKRGDAVLEEENYMSTSLINDVVERFKRVNHVSNLDMVVDLDPKVPTLLNGDIKKLHKIFRHLMDNAVKFTRTGGIYVRVYAVPRDYGINLMIQVTDTGIGMTRKDIASVSKGMYQANKKRNRSNGGIGLGLAVVYGFVHEMGGFVKIQSVKGEGTVVQVSVPQKVMNAEPCLRVNHTQAQNVVLYLKPEKHKVPELRDFYKNMAVNLATGLKIPLYAANSVKEVERHIAKSEITHIFTGQEEYEADKEFFNDIARKGIIVGVSAASDYITPMENGIIIMPKPLYGFPVTRILNNEVQGGVLMSANEQVKPAFNGVRALIVDDEPTNLIVASGLFNEYSMTTDTAGSGKEAIEKYRDGNYNVIFMDHMMPEMDGVEAMKRIRFAAQEMGKRPIIIALTANALSGAREMFMREGFDGFIAKPIDINEFERVMMKVLPGHLFENEGGEKS